MDSIAIFTTALEFEEKIRDLYRSAVSIIDDDRGRTIFGTLAEEEQSHVDFLVHSLEILRRNGTIDPDTLSSAVPDIALIRAHIEGMKTKIPQRMLGDIKTVLANALAMETRTTEFYRLAHEQAEGDIKDVLAKFVEIEQRHTDVVQIELDQASRNGFWFDFMEISMETE